MRCSRYVEKALGILMFQSIFGVKTVFSPSEELSNSASRVAQLLISFLLIVGLAPGLASIFFVSEEI